MKLKLQLILSLFAITAFGQSIQGTNTLLSKSNIAYQLSFDYKPIGAFTNTVNFKPISTNVFALKIHYGDSTNEYIGVIATNNALYFVSSNNLETARNFLIISNDVAGGVTVYTDAGIELGAKSKLGNIDLPWIVYGFNSYFKGATFGFMSPTNVAVTEINVSGNDGGAMTSFINPSITTPGMYEVACTAVVTQACVGAVMYPGVVASNAFGFTTNYMFPSGIPLTSLTNMSGSIITSNVNIPLAYNTMIKSFSSGTAKGYINWFVRQIQ